jgi:sn-glycerol 3-phosphate transport system ATP-binding protein
MRLEIKRLHTRLNATSIFVTHDQVEAMTLADQVVVMNAGKIEQIGAPSDVYRHPASRFVASFIGSPAMNLMPGKVVASGTVETSGGNLTFDAQRFSAAKGGDVEVGVRPEDIQIVDGSTSGIDFAPELIEELGATRLLHGNFGSIAITVATPASGPGKIGDKEKLKLAISSHAVHLFDSTSGHSLART